MTDETNYNSSDLNHSFRWQSFIVTLLVALIFLSTFIAMRRQAMKKADTQSDLLLKSVTMSKQAFFFSRVFSKFVSPAQKANVNNDTFPMLETLAKNSSDPKYWLELSLMKYYLGYGNWKQSLRNIGSSPSLQGLTATAWISILQYKKLPKGISLNNAVGAIQGMNLGWYHHLALTAVYNAGASPAKAQREMKDAAISVMALIGIGAVAIGGGFIGFALLLVICIAYYLHKQNPDKPLPAILTPHSLEPLDSKKGNLLYWVFIIYLLSFLSLGYAGKFLMMRLPVADRVISNPIDLSLVLTLSLISGLIPLCVLVVYGRKVGLKAVDLGYRRGRLGMDILWGVGGYLMSLPVVMIVSSIFATLFRHVSSPVNPALLAFTDSKSSFLKLFLFIDASVIAPFVEETMFRATFFRGLSSRLKVLPSMLLVSFVFASMHPQLPLGFPGLFLIGFALNALFYFRGSIASDITAHALNNAFIFLFLFLLLGR